MLASRENLDWMNEAPKMSYNTMLGKPVFVNREAFYVCLSGLNDPSIFEKVKFEFDEHFEDYYKAKTGDDECQPALVAAFIGDMVKDSEDTYKSLGATEGVDAFTVPESSPNTSDQKGIRWFDTEKLDKAQQKFKKKTKFYEDLDQDAAIQQLSEEIAKETDTYDNHPDSKKT